MNPYQHGAVAGEPHPNPALTMGEAVERSAGVVYLSDEEWMVHAEADTLLTPSEIGACSRPSCKRGARQEGTCIAHSPRTRAYLRERIAELSERLHRYRQLLARGEG